MSNAYDSTRSCLVVKYKESKLPNVKYIAASWMQLTVYAFPDSLVIIGNADIIDHMITELRGHIQRHKQNFFTFCYTHIDPNAYVTQERVGVVKKEEGLKNE